MGNALQLADPPPATTRMGMPSPAIASFHASPPRRRDSVIDRGDVGEQHWDIDRNLLRSFHQHLEFARDLELVLGRNMATEKLKLGSPETPEEGPSKKRRAANVGHFQLDVGLDQFPRIVIRPTFSRLQIPQYFVTRFGQIPSNIILTTNTGCNWRMTMAREGDDAYIDQGWAGFTVAHQLQVGQFLIFKKVSSFEYSVVIFDHTCTEVMTRCRYHGDATRCVVFESHV
ncbi:hypothetical protein QYE76_014502 [Lolium multiflorum]|uniref:TF-B3 domain-containing protein n=1 Tax=Lolium multiflorum TaxID=4521 RepID=A0AAD8X6V3_LOLMU|nr:hypothetical protein QYE76_014502 [Lolium multiflorum]